jgi:hypothetical protein
MHITAKLTNQELSQSQKKAAAKTKAEMVPSKPEKIWSVEFKDI